MWQHVAFNGGRLDYVHAFCDLILVGGVFYELLWASVS